MDLVVVADPLDRLDPAVDTTLGIVAAALDRGHHVRACLPSDLAIVDGAAVARTYDVRRGDARWTRLDDVDAVLVRPGPPVDRGRLDATLVLDRVDRARTLLVNDPRGVRAALAQPWAREYPDLHPPRATTSPGGSKRLFVHDGEPIAAALRLPVQDGSRGDGTPARLVDVDDRDRVICDRLRPRLRALGLYLVGLDVVDGWLVEVDVVDRAALRTCDRLLGSTLCADLVDLMATTVTRVAA